MLNLSTTKKDKKMNFDDNSAARHVIRFINGTNQNIFLTGKAGTGKTTLLKNIVKNTHKQFVIVAPTGIAALNAGGVTIHSLFQIPPSCYAPEVRFNTQEIPFAIMPFSKIPKETHKMNGAKRQLLRSIELLIIDEVSMLRADLLDAIDVELRYIRHCRHLPFGGVQVLFIGDMLQLPPVVKQEEWDFLKQFYNGMYFFDSLALRGNQPITLELEKIYRQSDFRFIEILGNLRDNKFVQKDINELNKHYIPDFEAPKKQPFIFLTTHNRKADAINDTKLRKLKTTSEFFEAKITGTFPENIYPISPNLELRVGAQIMFIKNDQNQGQSYYNGKIGTIKEILPDNIIVTFPENDQEVEVGKYTWENIRYTLDKSTGQIEEEVIGQFIQYPIKLAWAVTVHKSQGLTFKNAIIDVSEAFAPGQIYVALSRLESLEGLVLSEPIVDDFPEQDKRVIDFTNDKKNENELQQIFTIEAQKYIGQIVIESFNFDSLTDEFNEHLTHYEEDNLFNAKSPSAEFKKQILEIQPKIDTLVSTAHKFTIQLQNIFIQKDFKRLEERIKASIAYFTPIFDEISTTIYTVVAKASNTSGMKTYIVDLQNFELVFFTALQKTNKCVKLIESMNSGKSFTKENLNFEIDQEIRKKILFQKVAKKSPETVKYTDQKIDTKEITYLMYSDGMTIQKIAEERKLTVNTINKHIEYYLAEGALSLYDFVEKTDANKIKKTIKKLNTKSVATIKEELPNYDYQDIRFVLANMEYEGF